MFSSYTIFTFHLEWKSHVIVSFNTKKTWESKKKAFKTCLYVKATSKNGVTLNQINTFSLYKLLKEIDKSITFGVYFLNHFIE